MDEKRARRSIIQACLWLQERELVIGTWGNVSVRVGDRIILTPSRMPYEKLTPEDLVVIDLEGRVVGGRNVPTSERDIHRLIYRSRTDVSAVVHSHSEFACAVSAAARSIPPLLEEMSQLLGGGVSCTARYIRAGRHLELAREAVRSLGKRNAVLLRNHGPVCCGRDLEEALLVCLVVEKSARVFLSTCRTVKPVSIPPRYVDQERHRFLHTYGKE